jgi:hypothetical protein
MDRGITEMKPPYEMTDEDVGEGILTISGRYWKPEECDFMEEWQKEIIAFGGECQNHGHFSLGRFREINSKDEWEYIRKNINHNMGLAGRTVKQVRHCAEYDKDDKIGCGH